MENNVKELIVRVKNKKDDFEAWDKLYLIFKGFLRKIIRRYVFDIDLQQDVMHEVWIKVLKNIRGFDENRSFEAWLHVVARNVCLTWIQYNKGKIENRQEENLDSSGYKVINDYHSICFDENYSESIGVSSKQRDFVNDLCEREAIKDALDSIKDRKYVLAFKYKFIDGLTLKQISKIFSTPENVVKNWIYREVVYKIRPILEKSYETKSSCQK